MSTPLIPPSLRYQRCQPAAPMPAATDVLPGLWGGADAGMGGDSFQHEDAYKWRAPNLALVSFPPLLPMLPMLPTPKRSVPPHLSSPQVRACAHADALVDSTLLPRGHYTYMRPVLPQDPRPVVLERRVLAAPSTLPRQPLVLSDTNMSHKHRGVCLTPCGCMRVCMRGSPGVCLVYSN